LKAGANKDGTLVAVQATQYRLGGIGGGSQAPQPYPVYRAGESYREVYALQTNEDSSIAMRAPGHPQASFAMESLLDELAYKIGMDPVAFAKKNMRDVTIIGNWTAVREINWARRNVRPGAGAGPLKRGMAVAQAPGAGRQQSVQSGCHGRARWPVLVAVGTQDLGTGTRTYTRAIVAKSWDFRSMM